MSLALQATISVPTEVSGGRMAQWGVVEELRKVENMLHSCILDQLQGSNGA